MAKKILLNGLEIYLLAQKAIFIPSYELLLISDWHLGKLTHFRRAGFFVPATDAEEEFNRVRLLIDDLAAKQVLFLGDLFHSEWNADWEKFKLFLNSYAGRVKFILTKGNHDILEDHYFEHIPLEVKNEHLLSEGIVMSHEPLIGLPDYLYNIVGHIHPGYLLEYKARQTFRLPCFHLEGKTLTMPAFGKFTGLHMMSKGRNTEIFAIINDSIVEV